MTLTPNLIACLAIGGAGILTALLSIPFFQHTGMLRRKCSACTTGTVVRYRLQRRGSGCGTSIAPVVEFQATGETYTAYRHYKGIAVSKKVVPISDGTAGETRIAVRNDVFHIQQTGTVHSLEAAADWVKQNAREGDLVITLGCGDIYKASKMMVADNNK